MNGPLLLTVKPNQLTIQEVAEPFRVTFPNTKVPITDRSVEVLEKHS